MSQYINIPALKRRYAKYRDHPAHEEGQDANLEGKRLEDNPYPSHTEEWYAWRVGWYGLLDW